MTMAEIWSGRSPSARSRLNVSRPEMPASTRIRVVLLATRAQFPRLPLASRETDTAICLSLSRSPVEREYFFPTPAHSVALRFFPPRKRSMRQGTRGSLYPAFARERLLQQPLFPDPVTRAESRLAV